MKKFQVVILICIVFLLTISCTLSGQNNQSNQNVKTDPPATQQPETFSVKATETEQVDNHPGSILYTDSDGLFLLDMRDFKTRQLVSGGTSDELISPDGQYLAYLEKSPDPEKWMVNYLKIMDLDTGQYLDTNNVPDDIYAFTWSKSPGTLTYSRKNYNYCSDQVDRNITGLYNYDIFIGETTPLHIGTDQFVFWVQEWSPDGRYLLFSHGPDCSEGWSLLFFDSQTEEINGIPFTGFSWAPNKNIVAATRSWFWEPEEVPLMQYDFSTAEQEELFFEPGKYVTSPTWSPNGEWIAFSICNIEDYQCKPVIMDVITKELSNLPMSEGITRFWNKASDWLILSTRHENGEIDIYKFDIKTRELEQILSGIEDIAIGVY